MGELRGAAIRGSRLALVTITVGLGGCSAAAPAPTAMDSAAAPSGSTLGAAERDHPLDASSAWTWDPPAAGTPVAPLGPDLIPVAQDDGYAAALDRFGADAVQAAVEDDLVIARTALADCQRRTTGVVSDEITSRLDPTFLAWVEQRLAEPAEGAPPLLSELPADDGNGNNLAAAARDGCAADGPMQFGPDPLTVRVESDELVVAGSYGLTVSFGDLDVGAGQDWIFTSARTDRGWALVDAVPSANTNWFPAP